MTMKLAKYLASKRNTLFEWGVHDCNTLVVQWHDYAFQTSYYQRLYKKYSSRKEAYQFIVDEMDAYDWLQEAGYVKMHWPQCGDIIVDGFSAWIVLGQYAYSVHEYRALTRFPTDEILSEDTTIWRHKSWVQ